MITLGGLRDKNKNYFSCLVRKLEAIIDDPQKEGGLTIYN